MALKFKFTRASYSSTWLWCLVFAFALIVQVTPASAEPVTLICNNDASTIVITYRIDFTNGQIEQLAPSGKAYTNRVTIATVSPNAIVWSIEQPSSYLTGDNVTHQTTEHWAGNINRLSGTGWTEAYNVDQYHNLPISFTCRTATQKF